MYNYIKCDDIVSEKQWVMLVKDTWLGMWKSFTERLDIVFKSKCLSIVKLRSLVSQTEWSEISEWNSNLREKLKKALELTL